MKDLENTTLSANEIVHYDQLLAYYPHYSSLFVDGWYGWVWQYWNSSYIWDPFWNHSYGYITWGNFLDTYWNGCYCISSPVYTTPLVQTYNAYVVTDASIPLDQKI